MNVDIISMSWSVKKPEETTEQKREFDAALANAIKKGILMFCSSGDRGDLEDRDSYPGAYRHDKIFRVGAANSGGRGRDMTPNMAGLHYILPGQEVLERRAKELKPKSYNGSSVATALASGLAALVFHCIRVGAIYSQIATKEEQSKHRITLSEADYIASRNPSKAVSYMARAFDQFGRNEINHRYIEVWNWLEHDPVIDENWRRWTAKERMAAIAKIGQGFVFARQKAP